MYAIRRLLISAAIAFALFSSPAIGQDRPAETPKKKQAKSGKKKAEPDKKTFGRTVHDSFSSVFRVFGRAADDFGKAAGLAVDGIGKTFEKSAKRFGAMFRGGGKDEKPEEKKDGNRKAR